MWRGRPRPRVRMKLRYILIAALALFAGAITAQTARPGCAASRYKIIPLPFRPAHLNASGLVVGTSEDHQPATWTEKDGLREIELPAGFTAAEPPAMNRSGDIVGTLNREGSPRPFAFRYSGARLTLLSDDPSKAVAVADSGDVAGENAHQLVLWRKGKAVALGGCCGGAVHGINQHGEIVGQLNDKEGRYGAFLWDGHKLRTITPPEGTMSSAIAINDSGYVLLQSFTPNAVFLWHNGKLSPVQLANDVANQPLALNNCEVIVGEFGAASDFYHAFVWDEKNGQRDLNTLIDAKSGWTLESAVDINDRGEIIGIGDHGNDQDAGFLLVPDRQNVNHESAEGTRR
jgi:uncharacterized membrane protein